MRIDFSTLNLHYLVQARDLARQNPEEVAVLLNMPVQLAQHLAALTPEQLARLPRIKPPLLIPRQESWWWERLFKALQEGEPEEISAVVEHLSLLGVPADHRENV